MGTRVTRSSCASLRVAALSPALLAALVLVACGGSGTAAYEDLLLEVSSQLTDAIVVRPMDGGAGQAVVLAPVSAYVQSDPVAVPAWRPDGDVLAVATYDRHSLMGSPLYVLRADGSDLSVVPGIDDAMDPAWRPE